MFKYMLTHVKSGLLYNLEVNKEITTFVRQKFTFSFFSVAIAIWKRTGKLKAVTLFGRADSAENSFN